MKIPGWENSENISKRRRVYTKYVLLVLLILFIFAVGIVIGMRIHKKEDLKKSVGDLRIDTSDPDGPYLFLELDQDPGVLSNMDYVILKVNTKNYISQK